MSIASLVVVFARPAGPAPAAGIAAPELDQGAAVAVGLQGDVDCDNGINAIDSLQILRSVAGLGTSAGCLDGSADVDCSSAVDSVDALRILQYVASLNVPAADGCTPVGDPPGPLTPQVLTAWLYAAPNDGARYHVLLKVMELLSIGVYTADGGEIQQGAERGPGDFYLYDFELRMLAASLGRRDNAWGVQQIADTLDQVGYREDGLPFTGDDLNQILHDATNDSLATPEEASSLVPLLVRELGLRHETPYDLAETMAVGEAKFDGLQMMLVLTGLTLPVIADEGPVETAGSTLIAESNGILTAQSVQAKDGCSDFKSEGQELWPATKFFLTAVSVISAAAKRAVGFIDVGHGSALAFSVQVKAIEDDSEGSTHYDHGAEDPGRLLKFRIEVRMLDDIGETLVNCGWLATADFPAQGPIPDVKVQFNPFSSGLEAHGTLDCTGVLCTRQTDANGIATLTFDPRSEAPPYGQGIEATSTGSLEAIAWYQSRFKNIFGTLAQFVTPKAEFFAWSVRHHGCALELPQQSFSTGQTLLPPRDSMSIEAITSLDELPCQWTGTAHASTHNYSFGTGPRAYEANGQIDATFTFGNPQLSGNSMTVSYEMISGSATWQESGHWFDCTWSKGGTEEVHGGLSVSDDGSGQLTYIGSGVTVGQDVVVDCGVNSPPIATGVFFDTCFPETPTLTGLDVSGSCNRDSDTWNNEYNWQLSGISCVAVGPVTPQGTCGGAAAIP